MPKYKLTENGNAVIKDGKIVMIGDDGNEFEFDAANGHDTIAELRSEAGTWRKKLRTAESTLEGFAGIEDPGAALDALKTVATMGDDHKANMDNLKTELAASYDGAISQKDKTIADLNATVFKMNVTDQFRTSPTAQKLIYDPSDAAIIFSNNFEVDDNGQTVGKLNGNIIYSKEKPGEPAGFDEALDVLVKNRPNYESILKPSNMRGSGTPPNQGGDNPPPGNEELSSTESIKAGLAARQSG